MRVIAWLLAFANLGFFFWFGFYEPPSANAHYIAPLPSGVKALVLLNESTDEVPLAIAALDSSETLTGTAESDLDETALGTQDEGMTAVIESPADVEPHSELAVSDDNSLPEAIASESTIIVNDTATELAVAEMTEAEIPAADVPSTDMAEQVVTEPPLVSMAGTEVADASEPPPAIVTEAAIPAADVPSTDTAEPVVTEPPPVSTAETEVADAPASVGDGVANTARQFSSAAVGSNTDNTTLTLKRLSHLSQNVPTDFIMASATPTIVAPTQVAAAKVPATSETKGVAQTQETPICLQAGPYREQQNAQQVLIQVKAHTPNATVIPKTRQQTGSTWVYLEAYPTRADAEFVSTMLTRANIIDHYIVSTQPTGYRNAISLGLYRNTAVAQARIAELQGKGYHNVRQQQRYEQQTEYWLEISASAKQSRAWLAQPAIFQQAQVSIVACKQIAINQ